ncbi:MAG: helix-turn-helix transcriptional regulator [Pseudomonadota bacterium]
MSALSGNRGGPGFNPSSEGLIALFISDPMRAQATQSEILQTLYGLTRSQARLAVLLAEGHSVKHAAGTLGLTEGSARQYLKTIFTKTGTHRQADLVRKVLSGPAGFRPGPSLPAA